MNESKVEEPAACGGTPNEEATTECCGGTELMAATQSCAAQPARWVDGSVGASIGDVPRVATALSWVDHAGTCAARLGIGRAHYRVEPGLYAVGKPAHDAPVFVTANYKLSFDCLRSHLADIDGWILVLDTRGVNVWCAAGKGTFGTDEISRRVEATHLKEVVSHRRLILPQLGAPGVSAHEVARQVGFSVTYGPVRARDIPAFLRAGMKATAKMRRVTFSSLDRMILIPVEFTMGVKHALLIALCFVALAGFGPGIYAIDRAVSVGLRSAGLFLALAAAGIVLTPALLPWLPGRAFAAKGAWVGAALAGTMWAWAWARPEVFENRWSLAGWSLLAISLASFVGMNFTGSSTYTSLSGVRREMRLAVPLQAICAVLGAGLWFAARFV